MDVDKRGTAEGEVEPSALNIKLGHVGNFNMAAAASRDYRDLLSQGTVLPSPGAPVPVFGDGGPASASRFTGPAPGDRGQAPGDVPPGDVLNTLGTSTEKVPGPVQGMHQDPMAGWIDNGVPGFTGQNIRPVQGDGSAPGYTKRGVEPVRPNTEGSKEFKRSIKQQGNY